VNKKGRREYKKKGCLSLKGVEKEEKIVSRREEATIRAEESKEEKILKTKVAVRVDEEKRIQNKRRSTKKGKRAPRKTEKR